MKHWYAYHPRPEETRKKLSEANKANPKLMKPLSEERKSNISKGLMGHTVSEATRRKLSIARNKLLLFDPDFRQRLSQAKKGKKYGSLSAEVKRRRSEYMKAYWAVHPDQIRSITERNRGKPRSQETKDKVSNSLKAHYKLYASKLKGNLDFRKKMREAMNRSETKNKIVEAVKAYRINHPEFRKQASEQTKLLWLDDEFRRRCSEASKRRWLNVEFRKKMGLFSKKRWADPKFREKLFKKWVESMKLKPNKSELKLLNILNVLAPAQYKYTGDGSMIIAGKMPDFVNVNGQKKIIELFGQRWHELAEEHERIAHFKQLGWDCCVIWEHELRDLPTLEAKILSFVRGG
jgi:stalled ribosome alternative rescue factor ArfA